MSFLLQDFLKPWIYYFALRISTRRPQCFPNLLDHSALLYRSSQGVMFLGKQQKLTYCQTIWLYLKCHYRDMKVAKVIYGPWDWLDQRFSEIYTTLMYSQACSIKCQCLHDRCKDILISGLDSMFYLANVIQFEI